MFSLNIWGYIHDIVTSPSLISTLRTTTKSLATNDDLRWRVLRNVFRMPSKDIAAYLALRPRLNEAISNQMTPSNFGSLRSSIVSQMRANIPDLLTLNPSIVDQEPWERLSTPYLADDHESAEVNLLTLVQTFLIHHTTTLLVSPALISQEPEIAKLIADFHTAYVPLFTGMPRTVPNPSLPRAFIARRSLMGKVWPFIRALTVSYGDEDPGAEYRDLIEDPESMKPIIAARQEAFSSGEGLKLSHDTITADFVSLLWDLNAPNVLAFWLIAHLMFDEDMLSRVRAETKPFVDAVQPAAILGFSVPPNLKIDAEGMLTKCPLLRSCWLETVRLYARGLDSRRVTESFTTEDKSATGTDKWWFEKNEYVTTPLWVANTDEAVWRDARTWIGDRHVRLIEVEGKELEAVVDEERVFRERKSAEAKKASSCADTAYSRRLRSRRHLALY